MGRNLRNLLLPLLASYQVVPIHARFTRTTCWYNEGYDCVQRNAAGTWCYIPNISGGGATACTGPISPTDADFASVLAVHLAQGLSIAHYNGIDNSFLGGANYSIPADPGIIRLCVSGQSGDGGYQTLCQNAADDNSLGGPNCQVVLGQKNVTDGCYPPDVDVLSSSSIISSPGSVSTSSPRSTSPGPTSSPVSTNSSPSYTPAQANGAQSLNSMLHSVLLLFLPVILASSILRVFGLLMSLVVASSWLPSTHARFTQTTCWGDQYIQQNSAGTGCYIPNSALLPTTPCTTNPANSNSFLGGANFSLPPNPGIMSMYVGSGGEL